MGSLRDPTEPEFAFGFWICENLHKHTEKQFAVGCNVGPTQEAATDEEY